MLPEYSSFNLVEYMYYYDGAGVAVGDINNDGLPDLFFTANIGENKLFLNEGNFKFKDISEKSGITNIGDGWTNGVTMADVNGDGYLDIYVIQLGNYKGIHGTNQLFINNGPDSTGTIVTFSEKAHDYGLDFVGYGTHASFFDYDNDGDLDVYLVNHAIHDDLSYGPATIRLQKDSLSGDLLLRQEANHTFTDVTKDAGIYSSHIGYGLGVGVGDLNNDGWQDIYVSNDFHEQDYLYINNADGTFSEQINRTINHTSRSSMGNDIADFNNDGLLDIMVVDMLPKDEAILKRSAAEENMVVYNIKDSLGYSAQLVRNTLQLNRGNGLFSEIALLSNVYNTDWSWGPLIADLDNDGFKDLFITNGIYKRPNDLDYLIYANSIQNAGSKNISKDSIDRALLKQMPTDTIANFAFKNNGDLTFKDVTSLWGLNQAVFANGSAYVDLDNDGDLDLVTNNLNQKASVYRNNSAEKVVNHYLRITLKGTGGNTHGIGAKVFIYSGGSIQFQQMIPARGFLSSVDQNLTFGLGQNTVIDSLRVIWPNALTQRIDSIKTNQTIRLDQDNATDRYNYQTISTERIFTDISDSLRIAFKHQETRRSSSNYQLLKPHSLGTQGPKLAVGDVNNDGLEDIYVGGAIGYRGELYIQRPDKSFIPKISVDFIRDRICEDVDAVFADLDGDGNLDLYVVGGGDEIGNEPLKLKDRIYLNDGLGNFKKAFGLLPKEFVANGSCVAPMDYDNDGDIDLFVGSRSVINRYGIPPKSYLLQNDGSGKFIDVTEANDLGKLGMVTSAIWSDYNQDKIPDLIVAGEWMPVMVFKNDGKKLHDVTKTVGLENTSGWWNKIVSADLDGDGDMDLIAGNLGLNSKLKAEPGMPVSLFIKDFDNNGALDHILCTSNDGKNIPFASRDELISQIPGLSLKFITYNDYANVKSIEDIFSKAQLNNTIVLNATTFTSSWFENVGNSFKQRELPVETQFTPVFAISTGDFNHDNYMDILMGGNFTESLISLGLYDAGYGTLLLGMGNKSFKSVELDKSGFVVKGNIRDIKKLIIGKDVTTYLVSRNNDSLRWFEQKIPGQNP